MDCPTCKGCSSIIGSRNNGAAVYRERKCLSCGHIFYTEEHPSESSAKYRELTLAYYKEYKFKNRKPSTAKRYTKGEKR